MRLEASPLATYLSYLNKGVLAYQFSPAAGRAVFFPRVVCPFTGSTDLEWRESSGLGTVYATTFIPEKSGDAYNVALIDVEEGFRLMSRVEGIAPPDVRIGMRVRMRVRTPAENGQPYPFFVPAEEQ